MPLLVVKSEYSRINITMSSFSSLEHFISWNLQEQMIMTTEDEIENLSVFGTMKNIHFFMDTRASNTVNSFSNH